MRAAVSIMLLLALAGCASTGETPVAAAGGQLSEEQATGEAGRFLTGTYYGEGPYDAINNITDKKLLPQAVAGCPPSRRPVWAFHLHHPYDGWLYLDAVTGEKTCSTLPFIR